MRLAGGAHLLLVDGLGRVHVAVHEVEQLLTQLLDLGPELEVHAAS